MAKKAEDYPRVKELIDAYHKYKQRCQPPSRGLAVMLRACISAKGITWRGVPESSGFRLRSLVC